MHLEGADPLAEDLSDLERWYERGLRSVGLVWSRPNAFAQGVPFEFPGSPDIGTGLSSAGRALVDACNRLGILVDLSHLNEAGFWDVARVSDAPLVATHSNAHALCASTRNLTDAQLEAVRDSGGLVGVNFAVNFLREDGDQVPDTPIAEIVRHVDYLAEQMGIDHVAFGSDFDGAVVPEAVGGVTGFPRIIDALAPGGLRRRVDCEGEPRELAPRPRGDVESMMTRKLGPLEVTVVGLGCNNFGGRVDEAGTRAVIDAALEAGVTFFDTADIYGNAGGSETLIGKVLDGRRDQVVLATKFGKPMGDGAARRGSRDYVRAAIEASLSRLRTDHIDLYQHHEEDADTPLEETFGVIASSSPKARCARSERRTTHRRRSSGHRRSPRRWRCRTSRSKAITRGWSATPSVSCCRRASSSASASSRTFRSRAACSRAR